jgi:hypothetical protein
MEDRSAGLVSSDRQENLESSRERHTGWAGRDRATHDRTLQNGTSMLVGREIPIDDLRFFLKVLQF